MVDNSKVPSALAAGSIKLATTVYRSGDSTSTLTRCSENAAETSVPIQSLRVLNDQPNLNTIVFLSHSLLKPRVSSSLSLGFPGRQTH